MPLRPKELAIGLVLIVIGILADIGASSALPAPPACNTAICNAAAIVGLISLLLLIVGVGIQVRALTRARAEATIPPEMRLGAVPPAPLWGPPAVSSPVLTSSAPAGPSAPPPPPSSPATGSAHGPQVRCGRCGRGYPVGEFAYCPACGNPLPFAP